MLGQNRSDVEYGGIIFYPQLNKRIKSVFGLFIYSFKNVKAIIEDVRIRNMRITLLRHKPLIFFVEHNAIINQLC